MPMPSRARTFAFMGGVSVVALMASTGLASTAVAAEAGAKSDAPALEEIVVTADRKGFGKDLVQVGSFRGARIIDTPMTVSVIPQEVIKSQQALTLLDALKNTAGVTSSQTSPTVYNNLAIRGINVENRGNFRLNSSLPIVNLIDLPLEDKDRVEALKGASALYYGFTTPSGIINMTMKRPTEDPFTNVTVFGNDHGSIGGHVDTSQHWGMFGARVNAVYADVDSGIAKTQGHRSLVAGAFDLKPNDKLTISLDAEYIEKTVPEPTVIRFTTTPKATPTNLYPAITLPPLLASDTNLGEKWMKNEADETNVLGHVNYKLNESWALTVDAGRSELHRTRRFSTFNPTNLATGEGTLAITLQNHNEYINKNVRAELAGTFYTGPLLHELLVGASKNERTQFNVTQTNGLCPNAAGVQVTCTQNYYNPRPIPETLLSPSSAGVLTAIDDVGYYAFDRIKYGEWLQVLAGVRKSDYKESNRTTDQTTFKDKPTSYSVGVVLKPRKWASIYGTYIEGLESTPIAPTNATNAGAQLPATSSTQYEGGIKIEPKSGLLFQAAYFDIDRGVAYVNAASLFVQDGRARFKGLEYSLTGEVTPSLSIYASGLFLSAKQTSGAPTVITTSASGVVTVTPTSVGKLIENTPKRTFSLSGEYRLDQWVHGLSVSGGAFYTSKRAINNLNQAFIPGYTLLNLGVAYHTEIEGHDTTFRVNAENITKKKYWASTGGLLLAEGPPETIKFSVSSQF
ncbi:MAG: TonB-dependent siderophore receptor [Caulobacterales bacterium]|nr:TonB-dependent siderophore receptor [Caulobacterales bacterium]